MKIPEGFSAITPYLFVDKPHDYVEFLMAAFGAVELGRTMRGERLANVCLAINDARLFLGEATEEYPAMTTSIYLYVANVDKAMAQALEAGGVLEMDIRDMPHGDRQGGIRDQWGNIWWVSQHLN